MADHPTKNPAETVEGKGTSRAERAKMHSAAGMVYANLHFLYKVCGKGEEMQLARHVSPLAVVLLILFSPFACSYPTQQWKEYTEKVKRMAEEPKTPEGKCQRQGGILYNGQCYTPSPNGPVLDEETCHMRGGLYIEDKCLVTPKGRSSF